MITPVQPDTRAGSTRGPERADELRFPFGRNWAAFLSVLNEERIREAEGSLLRALGPDRLKGATFLDIGCGSGLFSLAAMRLGARRVHSFDFDPDSVGCARELRRRFFPDAVEWTIERGSVLDTAYLSALGQWSIVYSWGVLHHTGRMWDAIGNAARMVAPGGALFIAIYNDEGPRSRMWGTVKRIYNRHALGRAAVSAVFIPYFAGRGVLVDIFRRQHPARRYRDYYRTRGMSMLHDWTDWLGGYPFEVARPEEIFDFLAARGFTLRKLSTCNGLGCNEFVLSAPPDGPRVHDDSTP
jgi:2-polyprenyl-3-methyl-5-hydroxy-6-metoxy-1,4-benzoquinol methylase